MAEATLYKDANANAVDITSAPAAVEAGEVLQLADGRAAVKSGLKDAESGDAVTLLTRGQFTVDKASDVVILDGGMVKWDYSADEANIPVLAASKDFYLGRAVGDAAASDSTLVVELNASPDSPYITLGKSAFRNALVVTDGHNIQASMQGGSYLAAFDSAVAEAQKVDLLSNQGFGITDNWIWEGVVEVTTNADADVGDLNLGVASATHASDADSIAESAFFHFDMGADTDLDAESDDGTNETIATDTTEDWTVGTPIHLAIDGRDESGLKYYVNGVRVLSSTTFNIEDGSGPLYALFHLEKSSNDSPGKVRLDTMEVRLTTDVES